MRAINRQSCWSYFDDEPASRKARNKDIRSGGGCYVASYLDLAKRVAELQFKNPEFVLLFRGQSDDHKNRLGNTTLKPSLFRPEPADGSNPPSPSTLDRRFRVLKNAEEALVGKFSEEKWDGKKNIERYRILRWSILQHYEVCPTPLLDVTQSVRVAASFAADAAPAEEAFFYVLAVPNISGAVTASAESGLQIVRLSGICPPSAVRPHIQEGYLLGEYPDMPDFDQKRRYEHYEVDFGRRLIAKFRFNPRSFWKREFCKIDHKALYPNDHDPMYEGLASLRSNTPNVSC